MADAECNCGEVNALGQELGARVEGWRPPPRPDGRPLVGRFCSVERLDVRRHGADLYRANQIDHEGRMWTYLPHGPFADYAEYEAWLKVSEASADPFFYAIVAKSSGKAVGLAAYLRLFPEAGSIEVGALVFSPLLQRTPAATEAMALMMGHAFALGYRRYEWKCDVLNTPSRQAALRLGFRYEGTFRQAAVVKGRNRDTAWYAITDGEWPAVQAALAAWLAPRNFSSDGQQKQRLAELRSGAAAGRALGAS
ncbi:MAG: GNAT family N-acetyltransferase [Acidiferrobacter sp.]